MSLLGMVLVHPSGAKGEVVAHGFDLLGAYVTLTCVSRPEWDMPPSGWPFKMQQGVVSGGDSRWDARLPGPKYFLDLVVHQPELDDWVPE